MPNRTATVDLTRAYAANTILMHDVTTSIDNGGTAVRNRLRELLAPHTVHDITQLTVLDDLTLEVTYQPTTPDSSGGSDAQVTAAVNALLDPDHINSMVSELADHRYGPYYTNDPHEALRPLLVAMNLGDTPPAITGRIIIATYSEATTGDGYRQDLSGHDLITLLEKLAPTEGTVTPTAEERHARITTHERAATLTLLDQMRTKVTEQTATTNLFDLHTELRAAHTVRAHAHLMHAIVDLHEQLPAATTCDVIIWDEEPPNDAGMYDATVGAVYDTDGNTLTAPAIADRGAVAAAYSATLTNSAWRDALTDDGTQISVPRVLTTIDALPD